LGYNSESPELWTALAELYANKYRNPEQAYALYLEAARRPGSFRFVERFAYFQLAKVRGREREAYENLRRLYLEDEDNRKPTLLRELGRLERELNVPEAQRLVSRTGS
jgi:TPR repeat protein